MKKIILLLIGILMLTACHSGTDAIADLSEQAEAAYQAGHYEEALALYDQAIASGNKVAVIYNNRGLCYMALDQYEEAVADFEKAAGLETDAIYFGNLGEAYKALGLYQDAERALTLAIENNSQDPDYYLSRAQVYDRMEKYAQAISDYTETIHLGRETAVIYNNRGSDYYLTGEYEKAAVDYTQALTLNPDEPLTLYRNRAEAYRAAGSNLLAISDYEELIAAEQDDAEALLADEKIVAGLYQAEGMTEEAIPHLTAILEAEPDDADVLQIVADHAYAESSYEEAISLYTRLIKLQETAENYDNRADCYLQIGDTEKAMKDLDQAIKLNPKDAWAYYTRGTLYLEQEDYEKAEADFAKAEEYS